MTVLRQLLVRCHCWLAQQWESGTRCALLDKTSSGTPRRSLVGCLFAFTFALTSLAPAAVIERDWREAGDGLLTFDTVNQREWLDVPESLLANFPDGVLDELEPSGRFEGFTLAMRDDVFDLARSAGIDTSTFDFATNGQPVGSLVRLLGVTAATSGFEATLGMINVSDDSDPFVSISQSFINPPTAGIGTFDSFGSIDRPQAVLGLFLFRAVPEPSTVVLVANTVLALLISRRWLRYRAAARAVTKNRCRIG